ncbi:peptidoglycan editing factor PgeF [Aliivibrio fischeri]|uniref:peptidoglycan editing factor PgeF n=1 Tax=Aliivibrio fischeri TaxID=668 RepID=UPI001F2B5E83|nr:peptidoglycan editing factor PgeF [Aliivibrio fischeri]MCE7556328.1 peptidoglycan editing factor PgeF [Aliivibrio fischeri]MCE7563867.1 peptidoglycan editing factor PgeF [Aliivibrio fischeri]MCE7571263.1 peptidoglycan editing factor PgeF [Aliivibrio fischeri]
MSLISPKWSAPKSVKVFSTTRIGGVSSSPFDSFNLGDHVGDDHKDVVLNREKLITLGQLPTAPTWLNQIHSTRVVHLPNQDFFETPPSADAAYTNQAKQVCCVMTADCLPVVICNKEGTEVAAAHAGWRGLLDGVLENTVEQFTSHDLIAWCGPAIGEKAFEVGNEVKELFCEKDPQAINAFIPSSNEGKWLANLAMLATQRLNSVGINDVHYSNLCTYQNTDTFFSYRKEGITGRQATLIWFE